MRLGGTVCCDHPAEWEDKLVQSGFRAITAPFTCETPLEETERLLRIVEKHDIAIAEVGVWRNPFDPVTGPASLDYAVRQLQLADKFSIPCCVNIAGTESPFGWDAADPGNFSETMYRRLVSSIRESFRWVLLIYGPSLLKHSSMKLSASRNRRGQLIMFTKSMCTANCSRSTSFIR